MSLLQQSIESLPNIGTFYQKKLNKLNITSLFDLLTYAPRVYEARKKACLMQDLTLGQKNAIIGKVLDCRVEYRKRRMLLVTLADGTGLLTLRFFRFYPNQVNQFSINSIVYAFGEVRLLGGNFEMLHPEFQLLEENEAPHESYVFYPLSEGLTQGRVRSFIESALRRIKPEWGHEVLPAEIIRQFDLKDFWESIAFIHMPPSETEFEALNARTHPMQFRLIFEELLAHRLAVKQPVQEAAGHQIAIDQEAVYAFLKALPFELTQGQTCAITEILQDLQQPKPMQRLLQGDVGSGKTLVAFLSALAVLKSGHQVGLMAPTEILAEQLYEKAQDLFEPLGISVVSLLGKQSAKIKKQTYTAIESGVAQFIIGTHAVIQEQVIFKDLGLIIVDEQHRFGVGQRLKLHQKGMNTEIIPHQLIMSATPIPRTLAMTLYADLDISNIVELPKGRKPIETVLIGDIRRADIINRLKNVCTEGEQAYWICPLIEESEKLELEAAEATYARLSKELPGITVALLHGRMKGSEKSAIMNSFKEGKIQILVATTVVEVGVDVPNASIIIIENPERMGLSQLHQLRGRVGRGEKQSYCVLLYHPPLGETSMTRLNTLRESQNGFELAEKDLELRGPGDFLGTRQTGGVHLRFASLIRDQKHLKVVHHAAEIMRQKYPEAAQQLIERWFNQGTEFVKV